MQFASYLPYGEALADEHTVTDPQPYKFSGKELDGETGLYYFGARYYNPKLAVWYGVDPLAEKREWVSPYNFCSLNPINRTDPTGTLDDWIYSKETETYVWDGNVTKPSKTPAGHEYVGASLKDVATHFEGNNPIASIFTSPKFGADRTPWPGEISPTDNLTSLEFWLRSPSESVGEGVGKIAANIGYSIANSPYSLVRGQTLGGTPLIGREKMDAFVDVVPGLLTGGLTKAGLAVKTTAKGVPGFNQFVKRSLGITTKEGLPAGTKWQQRAGRLFQTNKVIQQGLKDFGKVRNVQNVGNTTKNELEK